ncbi:glycosyltransferase family 2 protein [Bacillus sp. FJAT-49705]|uniref:Glycosyltransferase family 2 protein n=1 Tax=Cytobacillus citreus TaxID=2833586 RepID=A0ABS5NY12_9BACI|nr:glycosyltransferase family 2 protein [Cytobacillus citreus]
MVSIIACTIRDDMMDNVFNNYSRQLWPDKELIIILNNDNMKIKKWQKKAEQYENVSVYQLSEDKTLGECLNFGIEKAKYDIVAKFDDDDYYSPYYFSEAMEIFQTTDAQLVGKGVSFMYFEKNKLLTLRKIGSENQAGKSGLKGGTLIFRKEIYPTIKFPSHKGSGTDSKFVRKCRKKNIKIYSTSRYNYVYIRRVDKNSHTYKQSNAKLKKKSEFKKKVENFESYVTKEFGS